MLPLGDGMLSYSVREPLGVVAAIVPWNAPVLLASLKIAMALCTGNTLVLKAAEDAPLGVLRMAEVCARAPARRRAERADRLRRGVRRRRCSTTPGSPRSPSPGRPRSAGSRCAPRPSASFRCRWSSAARRRRSSTRTPTTTPRSRTSSPRCASPARASRAPPAPGCTCTTSIFDDFTARLADRLGEMVVGDALDERSDIGSVVSGTQDARVCALRARGARPGRERARRRAARRRPPRLPAPARPF